MSELTKREQTLVSLGAAIASKTAGVKYQGRILRRLGRCTVFQTCAATYSASMRILALAGSVSTRPMMPRRSKFAFSPKLVSTPPGQSTETWMPKALTSRRRASLKPLTANLVALYTLTPGTPINPAMDEMLTM